MVLAWGELARRIVRVETGDGDGRPGRVLGTGFFVAPGWVLTCAHVVGGAVSVQVRADWSVASSPLPGRVAAASAVPVSGGGLWPFPDLALIELVGRVPDHPVVWLDETGPAGGRDVLAWGFAPRSPGEDPAGAAAAFGFEGIDGDGFLRLKAGQAARGLSGPPLVCPARRAVVGVVAASRDPASDLGGWASPVAGLMAGDLAVLGEQLLAANQRVVLADRGAWHRVLPVDAASGVVPERVWEGRFVRSRRALPSDLLLADFGVVPFLFRDAEVAEAVAWCQGPDAMGLAQVAGRGGAGKTRFAIEVCTAMAARGWLAGFWRPGSGPVTAPVPRLLVVDYAEAEDSAGLREGLLAARNSGSLIAPVRVLLLTRTRAGGSGDALEGLYEVAPASLRTILDASVDNSAAQHPLSLQQRRDLFTQARDRFHDAWHHDRPPRGDEPPALLVQDWYELPLEVLYEALDQVLAADLDRPAGPLAAPVDRVLAHEKRHWHRTISQVPGLDAGMAEAAVALATLAGAADRPQAHRLLSLLPALADPAAQPLRERVIDWVAGLYDGPGLLNPLRPDRLGEQLITQVLRQAPDGGTGLLTAALALPSEDQAAQVLEVLARICATDPATARVTAQALAPARTMLTDRAEAPATPTAGSRISRALASALTGLLIGPIANLATDLTIVPDADQPTYRYALGFDYGRLGDLARDAGQVEQARDLYTRARDIDLALVEQDPDNPTYRHALEWARNQLRDLA